jgi:K+-sensing histidine kinase KdpD
VRFYSAIPAYGLATLSVGAAVGAALLLQRFAVRSVEQPLFLFALAISSWYGGSRSAVLALVLSTLSFDYFFTEPRYTLNISPSDIPYFLIFASFAALVAWFSARRRMIEQELLRARDELQAEWRNAPSRPASLISHTTPFSFAIWPT